MGSGGGAAGSSEQSPASGGRPGEGTQHEAKAPHTVRIGIIVFSDVDLLLKEIGMDLTAYLDFNEGKR